MIKIKNLMSKIVIVFAMALMFGVLGHNNVYAEGVDQYTKLLLHMDDDKFKDECGNVVISKGVIWDKDTKKIGSSSAHFNGNSYLTIANGNDFKITNKIFTIDCWVYGNFSSRSCIISRWIPETSKGDFVFSVENRRLAFYLANYSEYKALLNGTTTLSDNTWYHVAVVGDGQKYYLFLNGKLENSIECSKGFSNQDYDIEVGKYGGNSNNVALFNGYIDELRISNGIARWISDFTPSDLPYSSITGITLDKIADTLQVEQTGQLMATITPDASTNKAVTWKSSDDSIATVDQTGKVTAVKEGTATITATTQDGSNLSASCVVTVKPKDTTSPTDNNGNAILTITMTNGNVKSYTVPMTKVNDFISWYNNRSSGSNGSLYYVFDKTESNQPFVKKSEYVVFDKISSFEVDEYSK